MPTLQIYDQLLQFPLFQGMSRDDLVNRTQMTTATRWKRPSLLRSFCSWSQHSAIISVTRTTSRQLPT